MATGAPWLVELWEKRQVRKGGRGQVRDSEQRGDWEKTERLRRKVLSFMRSGQLSRAMSRVTSHGVANPCDLIILSQLEAKFP